MANKKCPKCGGLMEEGISVEYKVVGGLDVNTNNPKNETWGKKVNKSWWQDSVNTEIPVVTYRCVKCGFLESYAIERK